MFIAPSMYYNKEELTWRNLANLKGLFSFYSIHYRLSCSIVTRLPLVMNSINKSQTFAYNFDGGAGDWLNNNVQFLCSKSSESPRSYAFNSFFYDTLSSCGAKWMARWTKKVNLLNCKLLHSKLSMQNSFSYTLDTFLKNSSH